MQLLQQNASQTASLIEDSAQRWYALMVRQRAEKVTATCLANKGYEYFLPSRPVKRQLSDRIRVVEQPLFPGYVFCRFDVTERLPLLTVPGVHSVVSFGREPIPVDDAEIAAIARIVDARAKTEEWPFVEQGQQVEITGGALKGLQGVVVRGSNGLRLVVSVSLLKRSVAVEVEQTAIRLL